MSAITHNSSGHPVPLWVDRCAALGVAALLVGLLVAARGHQVAARGHQVTARGHQVTARGHQVTARGHQVTARGHQWGRPHHLKSPIVVVRGHSQVLTAVLATAVDLQGTLYPTLPGANRLYLRVTGARSVSAGTTGVLTLRVLMPGMPMRPIDVALHEQGRQYRGVVVLPMFGSYIAHVLLVTPRQRWHGLLRLDVPLDLPH